MHEAKRSVDWPTVEGKILSHGIERHYHRYNPESFEPIVWYAYKVGEVEHKDSRISWYEQTFPSEAAANEFMDRRFPIDRPVRVHYDPKHPQHACLVPGGSHREQAPVFAAIAMGVIAIVVFAVRIRKLQAGGP